MDNVESVIDRHPIEMFLKKCLRKKGQGDLPRLLCQFS